MAEVVAADTAATRPATLASADEPTGFPDDAGLPVIGDESFENAAPAQGSERASERGANEDAATSAPTVAAMIERVSPATRRLLAELFKTEITTVRRISRDQLR